jgi:hypothetical protein
MPRYRRPSGQPVLWWGLPLVMLLIASACSGDSGSGGDGDVSSTTSAVTYPASPTSSVEALDGAAGIFSAFIIRPATAGLDPEAITGDAETLMALVDPERLFDQVEELVATRADDPQVALTQSAAVVEERFRSIDVPVVLTDVADDTSGEELTAPIVLGGIVGSECPNRVVLVVAPYDAAAGTPGADANASGIAAMVELAEVFRDHPLPMTMVFAAVPFGSIGSAELIADFAPETAEDEALAAVISVDRVGVASDEFDDLVGVEHAYLLALVDDQSEYLGRVFAVSAELFIPEFWAWAAEPPYDRFPDFDDSIQQPFWTAGIPAMWVTDTGALRDDRVGTDEDTSDIVDVDFLANSTRSLVAGLVGLGTIDFDRDGEFDVCTRPL